MPPPQFDPFEPAWLQDPYKSYRELREADPVHWSEVLGHWVLTRYYDCVAVLRDPRFTATNRPPQRRWNKPTMMVTTDPPDHSRLRRPVAHNFNQPSIESMRPRIQEVVNELADEAGARGELELAWEYARVLPRRIISEMMGVPYQPPERPTGSLDAMGMSASPAARPPSQVSVNRRQAPEHDEYPDTVQDRFFREALARHREELRDDVLQTLLAAESGGGMSDEEVLDTATILYGAGQETTGSMITNGVYSLLRNPDQLRKLQHNPALLKSATDEILRFEAPVHAVRRKATEEVNLGGKTIRQGDKVLLMLMAANHDPELFDDPDNLDIERDDNYHIAFGSGVHTCLGGILARAETQIAIGTLVERFPRLRLATDQVSWQGSLVIRSVRRLPVALS